MFQNQCVCVCVCVCVCMCVCVCVCVCDVCKQGTQFEPNGPLCRRLHAYNCILKASEGLMKQQSERLQKRINDIILEDAKRKYTVSTPVAHVPSHEKYVLSHSLRPKEERDRSIHPVHLHLYWAIKLEELEENIARFEADPTNFTVTEGYAKLLRFYLSGPVPAQLKQKATQFLQALEKLGKVSRPPSGARRVGGNRRLPRY